MNAKAAKKLRKEHRKLLQQLPNEVESAMKDVFLRGYEAGYRKALLDIKGANKPHVDSNAGESGQGQTQETS